MTPNDEFVKKVRYLSLPELQNRLMKAADREIALSMMYMAEEDRNYILSVLPGPKQKRVREELALHEHLRIRYAQYRMALDALAEIITGTGKGGLRSYLKPVRFQK